MQSRCRGHIVWSYLIDDYVIAAKMRLGLEKKRSTQKKKLNQSLSTQLTECQVKFIPPKNISGPNSMVDRF